MAEIIGNIVVVISLVGGISVFIVGLIELGRSIYDHFTWNELKLTEKEKEEFIDALDRELPTHVFLNEIALKRGFSWKSYTYNKVTRKLKVR